MAAVYITALKRHGLDLDDELAVPWLKKLFGDRVFRTIWEPLLAAKFGDRRDVVPAYWVWNTLNREKNGKQEVKGYIRGGYGAITDALARGIRERGARISMNTPVRSIESSDGHASVVTEGGTHRHDAVIATPPLALLRRMLSPALEGQLTCGDVQFQGVVNVVLLLKRRLSPYYWTAVVDSGFPFQGIVETTHVIPLDSVGGRHVVYVMNYCEPGSEPYDRTDDEQRRGAVQGLLSLYPDLREQDVEATYVFRTPWVEPVWTRGYLRRRPEPRLGTSRVFLCTTAQAYPMVTAWNTSVKLATDAVNALRGGVR
jgi:protoporphyrinogen oxidase